MALNFKKVKAAKAAPGNIKRPPCSLGKQKSNEMKVRKEVGTEPAALSFLFLFFKKLSVVIAQGHL